MAIVIDEFAAVLHATARDKGFWDQNNGTIFYLKQLAMVHSEVSEVLEAIRKEKGDDQVVEELADVIIRVLDLYAGLVRDGYTNISLEKTLNDKAKINSKRPKMHGVLA
jgi:NTP pyrophosphatase (non-canonical NTP hydrolase)